MHDIYRPLGLDARPRRSLPLRGSSRALAGAAAFALVLAGSAAIHRAQPEFRRIDVFAEAEAAARLAAAVPPADPVVTNGVRVATAPPLAPLGRSSAPEGFDADELPTVTYPPGFGAEFGKRFAVADPGSLRQPASAAMSPDAALLEDGPNGALPVRGPDGRRPFDVYAAESPTDAGVRVAIVVGGLGISQTGTMQAIRALPRGTTFGFAPSGNSLPRWMREARAGGHELILQVPLEPQGYPENSPGEHTLTAADAAAGRFDELDWALGRFTNYVGIGNYMGARLSADADAMRALASETARRGLLFFDDGTSPRSLARDAAREAGAPFASADVLLDAAQDSRAIAARLDTLERTARANGQAIGVASAFDVSVGAIAAWAAEAEKRGIRIVPLSALASDPETH